MRPSDQLCQFVRQALGAGRSRDEIRVALSGAGWTEGEIFAALQAWAEGSFLPPVPRPLPFVSGREAFLYGLMFLALVMTSWHLVALSFNLVDRWIPDVNSVTGTMDTVRQMRWSIALLMVFLPLFIILHLRTHHATRIDLGLRRSLVRKWFCYITLFLASVALLGDLIAVIYALLNGDLTLRFAAKTAAVAAVAGVVFVYFRGEMDEPESH